MKNLNTRAGINTNRIKLAELLFVKTLRYLDLCVEKDKLQLSTTSNALEQESYIQELLDYKMEELWFYRNKLDMLREQDLKKLESYKKCHS